MYDTAAVQSMRVCDSQIQLGGKKCSNSVETDERHKHVNQGQPTHEKKGYRLSSSDKPEMYSLANAHAVFSI